MEVFVVQNPLNDEIEVIDAVEGENLVKIYYLEAYSQDVVDNLIITKKEVFSI